MPKAYLPAPVLDATRVDGQLAVLTSEGVSLLSVDLSYAARLPAIGASSLLAAGSRLIVGGRSSIETFDLSIPTTPRRESEHARPAGTLFPAPSFC